MNVSHEKHEEHSPLENPIVPLVNTLSQEWDKYMKEMWGEEGQDKATHFKCLLTIEQASPVQEHIEICMLRVSRLLAKIKKHTKSSHVLF